MQSTAVKKSSFSFSSIAWHCVDYLYQYIHKYLGPFQIFFFKFRTKKWTCVLYEFLKQFSVLYFNKMSQKPHNDSKSEDRAVFDYSDFTRDRWT